VLLESDDRVGFATTAARELLNRYFGETGGAQLPAPLAESSRERRKGTNGERLRAAAGESSLVVEFVEGALLLEEPRWMPRLTPREREIIDLVAEGKNKRLDR
jgi:DNA-binding NarL/FixJ family response regulator